MYWSSTEMAKFNFTSYKYIYSEELIIRQNKSELIQNQITINFAMNQNSLAKAK